MQILDEHDSRLQKLDTITMALNNALGELRTVSLESKMHVLNGIGVSGNR